MTSGLRNGLSILTPHDLHGVNKVNTISLEALYVIHSWCYCLERDWLTAAKAFQHKAQKCDGRIDNTAITQSNINCVCTSKKIRTFVIYSVNTTYINTHIYALTHGQLEMLANVQRDGHPAEYRWRPLFNAAKFGWRPLAECHAVTLARRETRWNL